LGYRYSGPKLVFCRNVHHVIVVQKVEIKILFNAIWTHMLCLSAIMLFYEYYYNLIFNGKVQILVKIVFK